MFNSLSKLNNMIPLTKNSLVVQYKYTKNDKIVTIEDC